MSAALRSWPRRLLAAITLVFALLAGGHAHAHDPDFATFEARQTEFGWMLSAHIPSAAVHRALRAERSDFETLDRAAYEQALVAYLRAHIDIVSSAGPIDLGPGGVRLGGHQTDLAFELPGLPPQVDQLRIHVDAFAGPHQVNALRVRPRGAAHLRYMLRETNNYAVTWPLDPGVVLLDGPDSNAHEPEHEVTHADSHTPEPPWDTYTLMIAALCSFVFGLAAVAYKRS